MTCNLNSRKSKQKTNKQTNDDDDNDDDDDDDNNNNNNNQQQQPRIQNKPKKEKQNKTKQKQKQNKTKQTNKQQQQQLDKLCSKSKPCRNIFVQPKWTNGVLMLFKETFQGFRCRRTSFKLIRNKHRGIWNLLLPFEVNL